MEEFFAAVPESVRGRVAAVDSYEEIAKLIIRTLPPSLATMDF